MERRDFLKIFGVASGAILLPAAAVPDETDRWLDELAASNPAPGSGPFVFDPTMSYGNYVQITDDMAVDHGSPVFDALFARLQDDMCSVVPEEYRTGVYFSQQLGGSRDPLWQRTTLAWRYTPEQYERYKLGQFRRYSVLPASTTPLSEGITPTGRTLVCE